MKRYFDVVGVAGFIIIIILFLGACKSKNQQQNTNTPPAQNPSVASQTLQPSSTAASAEVEQLAQSFREFMMTTMNSGTPNPEAISKYTKIFEDRLNKGFKPGEEDVETLVRFALASIKQAAGKSAEAEKILLDGIEKFKNNPRYKLTMMMELAQYYGASGRESDAKTTMSAAIKELRSAIETSPENGEYHQLHLMLLSESDGIDEGLKYYQELAKKHPDVQAIASAIQQLNDFKKGAIYRNFMKELSESGSNEVEVARKYEKLFTERLKQGFAAGQEQEEIQLRSSLARAYAIQGRIEDGEKILEEGAAKFPGTPRFQAMALYELGSYYKQINRGSDADQVFTKAIQTIRKAIESDPDNSENHQIHTMLIMITNNRAEGLQYYQALATKFPDNPAIKEALQGLTTINNMEQDNSPKSACLNKIEVNINDRDAHQCLREAYEQEKAQYEYLQFIRNFVQEHPDSYAGWFQVGYALKEYQKDFDGAIKAFNEAIRLKPDYATAYYHLAWMHRDRKEWDESIRTIRLAAKYDPDFYYDANKMGYIVLYNKGEFEEALKYLRTSINDSRYAACSPNNKIFTQPSDRDNKLKSACYHYNYLLNCERVVLFELKRTDELKKKCLEGLSIDEQTAQHLPCRQAFPDWAAQVKSRTYSVSAVTDPQMAEGAENTCQDQRVIQILKEFESLTKEEKWVKGRDLLHKALEIDPKCYIAHHYFLFELEPRINTREKYGDNYFKIAVSDFCKAAQFGLSINDHQQHVRKMGNCYIYRGEFDRAIQYFQGVLDKYDDQGNQYYAMLGLVSAQSALKNCAAVDSLLTQIKESMPRAPIYRIWHIQECHPEIKPMPDP